MNTPHFVQSTLSLLVRRLCFFLSLLFPAGLAQDGRTYTSWYGTIVLSEPSCPKEQEHFLRCLLVQCRRGGAGPGGVGSVRRRRGQRKQFAVSWCVAEVRTFRFLQQQNMQAVFCVPCFGCATTATSSDIFETLCHCVSHLSVQVGVRCRPDN